MNHEMIMKTLEVEYAAIVEEQNRRARRIARATEEDRKKWEARYNKTMERRHGFETALKAIGYRVIRTYKIMHFTVKLQTSNLLKVYEFLRGLHSEQPHPSRKAATTILNGRKSK